MIAVVISIICWCFFCIFEGRFEAILWHLWARTPIFGFNPHKTKLLMYRRLAIIILASISNPLLFFAHALVFPFIHSGAMYSHRNDIDSDLYEDRWQSEPSPTSSAEINFSYNVRFILFAIGCFAYVAILFNQK